MNRRWIRYLLLAAAAVAALGGTVGTGLVVPPDGGSGIVTSGEY